MSCDRNEPVKILCVDDDPNILELHARILSKSFDVSTRDSPRGGLALLGEESPFAVVISDMDMPEINGATFLGKVRERSPATTRVLLTGMSDLEVAVQAINRGQIFRFLSKPIEPPALLSVVEQAVEHHRLVTAEKVLLEQTVTGAIKTLSELLSLVNPRVFEHANRARQYARHLAETLECEDRWSAEVGAVLLQLATLTLPPATLEKVLERQPLSAKEQASLERCPEIADNLISHIPRLESVRECLRYGARSYEGHGDSQDEPVGDQLPLGARIVKVATDFSTRVGSGSSAALSLKQMQEQHGHYDPQVLAALSELGGGSEEGALLELPLGEVRPGMLLRENVHTTDGAVVVVAGIQLTGPLIERLRNFASTAGIVEPLLVASSGD